MTDRWPVVLLLSVSLFAATAWSQTEDIATERSRVAEERIRVEAERFAQEEEQRAAAAAEAEPLREVEPEQAPVPAEAEQQDLVQPQSDVIAAPAPTEEPASLDEGRPGSLGMSLMLEHLNVLGQLRDSGYVTEAEFERIKQRILDGEL